MNELDLEIFQTSANHRNYGICLQCKIECYQVRKMLCKDTDKHLVLFTGLIHFIVMIILISLDQTRIESDLLAQKQVRFRMCNWEDYYLDHFRYII